MATPPVQGSPPPPLPPRKGAVVKKEDIPNLGEIRKSIEIEKKELQEPIGDATLETKPEEKGFFQRIFTKNVTHQYLSLVDEKKPHEEEIFTPKKPTKEDRQEYLNLVGNQEESKPFIRPLPETPPTEAPPARILEEPEPPARKMRSPAPSPDEIPHRKAARGFPKQQVDKKDN